MKKILFPLCIALIIGLSGCKNNNAPKQERHKQVAQVNMPFALAKDKSSSVSFFDEDVEAFVLEEEHTAPQEQESITLAENELTEEVDFSWEEMDHLSNASFETVYFDYDSKDIKPEEQIKVEHNSRTGKTVDDNKIIILKGKASRQGKATDLYKLALSEQRAEVVAANLEQQGIDRSRMKVFGVGCEEAVASGQTHENHQVDRCVQMYTIQTTA